MNIYNSSYAVKLSSIRKRRSCAQDGCYGEEEERIRVGTGKSIKLKGKKRSKRRCRRFEHSRKMYIAHKIMLMGMVEQKGKKNETDDQEEGKKIIVDYVL